MGSRDCRGQCGRASREEASACRARRPRPAQPARGRGRLRPPVARRAPRRHARGPVVSRRHRGPARHGARAGRHDPLCRRARGRDAARAAGAREARRADRGRARRQPRALRGPPAALRRRCRSGARRHARSRSVRPRDREHARQRDPLRASRRPLWHLGAAQCRWHRRDRDRKQRSARSGRGARADLRPLLPGRAPARHGPRESRPRSVLLQARGRGPWRNDPRRRTRRPRRGVRRRASRTCRDVNWQPLFLSLQIATIAMLVALVIGTGLALLLVWKKLPLPDVVAALISTPLVLPPTVLGYYLLTIMGPHSLIGRAYHWVTNSNNIFTFKAAVIAATDVSFPLDDNTIKVGLDAIEPNLFAAARTLGASPSRVLATITLPLAAPGIIAGAMLAFARALGDYGMTQMVASAGFGGFGIHNESPASIFVIDELVALREDAARSMAIATTLLGIVSLVLANRLTRRLQHG